jgi:DNA-binding transcriptional LysR family regulator
MIAHDPDWQLLRSFRAVYREKSLSGAARALGLTQPTVGRHIDSLEADLGVPLFVRSQSGLEPTEAAFDLVPHADAMASAAAALVRAVRDENNEARGTVRLTASRVIGAEVLPAILARFRETYPAIAVELVLTNRSEDLLRREADLAVRMIRPTQAALVARKIGESPVGLFAHRRYVDRHGLPTTREELTQHALIGPDADGALFRTMAEQGIPLARAMLSLRTDDELAQHALLRAGAGIGGMQIRIAARDPDLLPVMPEDISITMEMWLAMHENLRASRPVRLLFDHLAPELTEFVTLPSETANQ